MAKPLKFKTVAILKKKIEAYFASCWEPVMDRRVTAAAEERERERKPKVFTKDDYEWVQEKTWDGKPIFKQVRPYSITGLALALGTSRQTLLEYQGEVAGREKANPAYADAIKAAKLKCENYAEDGLLQGVIPPAPGIFNLKNNYGWRDEQVVEHKGENLTDLIKQKLESNRRASQSDRR